MYLVNLTYKKENGIIFDDHNYRHIWKELVKT